MREILFRGKTKKKGEWVYGYYVPYGLEPHQCEANEYWYWKRFHTIISCGNIDDYAVPHIAVDFHLVLPETVGQYVGLKDVKGNKIFEGDVVEGEYGHEAIPYWGRSIKGVVEYTDGYFGVNGYYLHELADIKVIGNLPDTPELLRGDK